MDGDTIGQFIEIEYIIKNRITKKVEKFEDLNIWQLGVELAVSIYKKLKDCRDFGLKDQMQRAAVSIPSNIAEGFDRNTNREFIRFLRIAKASCAELRTQLIISQKIELINPENLIEETKKLSAMIQKIISYREKINNL